jgi:WD40 repeat protein
VTTLAVAPDSTWLATTSMDKTARIWDVSTGSQRALLSGHTGSVWTAEIAPDGTWLATVSDDERATNPMSMDKEVRIWDVATGRQRAILTSDTGPVRAVAIAPDSAWLATASSSDNSVRIRDPVAGAVAAVMRVDSPLEDCAWSPSGRLLATVGPAGFYVFAFNS